MIFSENRYPLFGIMPNRVADEAIIGIAGLDRNTLN
jgi:hypothetical protein